MVWVYFAMAALWGIGCVILGVMICVNLRRSKGWRFVACILPLLVPLTFLLAAIPALALREAYGPTLATLRADEWACTDGYVNRGQTIAANTSQRTEHFVCTRYERIGT